MCKLLWLSKCSFLPSFSTSRLSKRIVTVVNRQPTLSVIREILLQLSFFIATRVCEFLSSFYWVVACWRKFATQQAVFDGLFWFKQSQIAREGTRARNCVRWQLLVSVVCCGQCDCAYNFTRLHVAMTARVNLFFDVAAMIGKSRRPVEGGEAEQNRVE